MSALSLAVLLGLAANPACGNASPILAPRLAAIAMVESGGHPDAVGTNAAGIPPDLGLMQINTRNLARHGLTLATALNPCLSMRAGADHYRDDLKAAFTMAHRHYNSGSFTGGANYAARVDAMTATVLRAMPPPLPIPPIAPATIYPRSAAARILSYRPSSSP